MQSCSLLTLGCMREHPRRYCRMYSSSLQPSYSSGNDSPQLLTQRKPFVHSHRSCQLLMTPLPTPPPSCHFLFKEKQLCGQFFSCFKSPLGLAVSPLPFASQSVIYLFFPLHNLQWKKKKKQGKQVFFFFFEQKWCEDNRGWWVYVHLSISGSGMSPSFFPAEKSSSCPSPCTPSFTGSGLFVFCSCCF